MPNETSTCLAVIPARGASKGVPRKNIVSVAGRPLIAWTIQCARQAHCVERVVVSTDNEEIARAARDWNAEVPFIRPAELAHDDTPGIDPLVHAVKWLGTNENYSPEWVMLLQPTSPLRIPDDIDNAFAAACRSQADRLVSVTPAVHHPFWMKSMDGSGQLSDFLRLDRTFDTRQQLPPAYAPNGSIYLIRREALFARESFFDERTYGYVMPPQRSLDIDTAWDLQIADMILRGSMVDE